MVMLVFWWLIFFFIKSARGIEPEVKMEGNKIFCQTYADGPFFFF